MTLYPWDGARLRQGRALLGRGGATPSFDRRGARATPGVDRHRGPGDPGQGSGSSRDLRRPGARRALFVGSTAAYLKAGLSGMRPRGPGSDLSLPEGPRRGRAVPPWETRRCTSGLAALDPPTAARLHPNDRRRVVRALEVIRATGRPLSEQQVEHERPARGQSVSMPSTPRGPNCSRGSIARVEAMFASGLVEEGPGDCKRTPPARPGRVAGGGVSQRSDRHLPKGGSSRGRDARDDAGEDPAVRQATERPWFRGLGRGPRLGRSPRMNPRKRSPDRPVRDRIEAG